MKHQRQTVLLLLTAALSGCTNLWPVSSTRIAGLQDAEVRNLVHADLVAFDTFFEARVVEAVVEIERRSANREHRRAATLWRTRMVPACQALAHQKPSTEVVT